MGICITELALLLVLHAGMAGCDMPTANTRSGEPSAAPSSAKADADQGTLDEESVKKFVTRKEESLATGVGSAHKSVKVEFVEVRIAKPRTPNEQDKIDGIRGNAVYAVRVKYKSLRTWGNGQTEEKAIHYSYNFYRDEFSEWNAIGLGPVK